MLSSVYVVLILASLVTTIPAASVIESAVHKITARQQKAQEILKYLNTSADPCEDFYEFTCGNYGKHVNEMDLETYGSWDVLSNITRTLRSKKNALLQVGELPTDTEADRKLRRLYAVCMNATTSLHEYREGLKQLINEFGKMPLLEGEQWKEEDFDWIQVVGDIMRNTGIGIILNAVIAPDYTNNTINRVALLQPNFAFKTLAYYEDEKFEYHRHLFKTFVKQDFVSLLGVDGDEAAQAAKEIYKFEAALAHAMQDNEMTPPEEYYALVSIDDLQRKCLSAWDTKKLFKTALDMEPNLVMIQPTYVQNAFHVIQNTPKRVMANYIFYTYIKEYTSQLSMGSDLEYNCQSFIQYYFEKHLENMIYRNFFRGHEKNLIENIWGKLQVTFEETLNSPKLKWMHSGNTLQNAVEKLRAMKLHISSYEDIDFEQELAELQIDDQDILRNIRALLQMRGKQARLKMDRPPQFKTPPNFSPSYTIEANHLYLPISLLQEDNPWSPSYPYAINLGNIGFYMGHEIVHGFDDCGRHFDASGSSRNWWDPESVSELEKRVDCFAKQYINYTYDGQPLPKIEVQAENISDNGGLQLSYATYQRWRQVEAHPKELEWEMLPGLNFTHNQLFFISFSQSMCNARNPNDFNVIDTTDIHVPAKLRVIVSLSNFEEFSKAFSCPIGSAMNPATKCVMY